MKNLFDLFSEKCFNLVYNVFSASKKGVNPKYIPLYCLSLILFLSFSCNTTDPKLEPDLKLELKDVSCTEAWLQLTTNNIQLPATINLLKNNSVTQTFSLSTQDSLLFIDSLLPNQTYKFKVVANTTYKPQQTTNEVLALTMDTTSHNFTFTSWTFGTVGSSVLYDVAIINENDIWAVGEILIADTSQNGYTTYNAVHWDGQNWELKRIMFYSICDQQSRTPYPAKAVFAYNENEIWIAMDGDQIAKLENEVQVNTICLPWSFSINKIWGSSSNDLYAVGNDGNIAHYQNGSWTKIESGTTLNIYDIYGQKKKNNDYEIICVAAKLFVNTDKNIFRIVNNTVSILSTANIPSSIKNIWFEPDLKYYVVGSGMFSKTNINSNYGWNSIWENITQYYTYAIDANEINDIIVCGALGELLHFNGYSWKSYRNEVQLFSGSFLEIKIKENLVVAVGYDSPKAVITIGKR